MWQESTWELAGSKSLRFGNVSGFTGFRVWGNGFGVQGLRLGDVSGFRVEGLGVRVVGLVRVQGLRFRVSRFTGFRVWGFGLWV